MSIMFDDILAQCNSFDNIIMDGNDMEAKVILCVIDALARLMTWIFSIGENLYHYGLIAFLII